MESENTEQEVEIVETGIDVQDFDDSNDEDVESEQEATPHHVSTPSPAFAGVTMSTLPITGEPRVDDALGRLTDLEGLPVHEHVEVFEDVRHRLHDTLSDLGGQ